MDSSQEKYTHNQWIPKEKNLLGINNTIIQFINSITQIIYGK